MITKYVQYSEDGKKWSYGGAAPFKYRRFVIVERDEKGKQVSRKESKAEPFEPTPKDPAAK